MPRPEASRTSRIGRPIFNSRAALVASRASTIVEASAATGRARDRRQVYSLVPQGFEAVAHPVFFSSDIAQWYGSRTAEHEDSSGVEQVAPSSPAGGARQVLQEDLVATESFVSLTDEGNDDVQGGERDGRSGGMRTSGAAIRSSPDDAAVVADTKSWGREVDVTCPICLSRLERALTLTSCHHTFCHVCIVNWYKHTIMVALADRRASGVQPGAPSAHRPDGGFGDDIPVPCRCPVCKTPGRYFLAFEAFSTCPSGAGSATKPDFRFKLLGPMKLREGVNGGVGRDDVEAEGAIEGSGDRSSVPVDQDAGYPNKGQLKLAMLTQLAVRAAILAEEEGPGAELEAWKEAGTSERKKICRGARSSDSLRAQAQGQLGASCDTTLPANVSRVVSSGVDRSGSGGGHATGDGDRSSMESGEHDQDASQDGNRDHGRRSRKSNASSERRRGGQGRRRRLGREERRSRGDQPRNPRDPRDDDDDDDDTHLGEAYRTERTGRRKGTKRERDEAGAQADDEERLNQGTGEGGARYGEYGGLDRTSVDAARSLPWDMGSLKAEDALAAVEVMLEREREALREVDEVLQRRRSRSASDAMQTLTLRYD